MGIYAHTETYFKICKSPVGREIDALYRKFEATPSANQRESATEEQDWEIFHEYRRRQWEEIERPGCYFSTKALFSVLYRNAVQLLESDMTGVRWDPERCRNVAVFLRKYVADHPPLHFARRWSKHQQKYLTVMTKGGEPVMDTAENDWLFEIASMLDAAARRGDYVYFA
jgi:hypothetical protein